MAQTRLAKELVPLDELCVSGAEQDACLFVQGTRVVANGHRGEGERRKRAGHAAPAARRADERHPADEIGAFVGQLLRDEPSEREAQDVHVLVPELVDG